MSGDKTALFVAVALIVVITGCFAVRSELASEEDAVTGLPQGAVLQQQSTQAPPDPYPGADGTYTPAPVPTSTEITTGVYEGDTHSEIATSVAASLVSMGIANSAPAFEDSADVTPSDAGSFGMDSSRISYQSENDLALIFSGDFKNVFPGGGQSQQEFDYILVLVDTDSGAFSGTWLNDSLTALQAMLP